MFRESILGRCAIPRLVITIFVTCCVWTPVGVGQTQFIPLHEFASKSWSTSDGLSHNSINSILQVPSGHIWLATWEGPVRFNGRTFEVFDDPAVLNVSDTGMYALSLSPQGNVYVGGARGAYAWFDGTHWHGRETPATFISDMLFFEGKLWLATPELGILIEQEETFTNLNREHGLPSNNVLSFEITDRGELFVGTSRGLALWNPDTEQFNRVQDVPDAPVRDILQASDGSLWVGSDDGLFIRYAARFNQRETPVAGTITQLHEHSDGTIFYGTFENGLVRLIDDQAQTMTRDSGLPNNHILAFYTDHEENLWVSTHGGLMQLRSTPFFSFTANRGLVGDYVRAIEEDQEHRIWIGTSDGVTRIDNHDFLQRESPSEMRDFSVLALQYSTTHQKMVIGTYTDGLYLVDAQDRLTQLSQRRGLLSNEVRAIAIDNEDIFIGTGAGVQLARVTEKGGLNIVQSWQMEQGLPNNFVTALSMSSDSLVWVGTSGGLAQLRKNEEEWQIQTISHERIAPFELVFSIFEGRDFDWLASDRGVLIYERERDAFLSVERRHGLPFEKIFGLTIDQQDDVWLATSRGMLRISKQEMLRVARPLREPDSYSDAAPIQYHLFTEADGIVSAQANSGNPAAMTDSEGNVWFATAIGAVRASVPLMKDMSQHAPWITIESVSTDGRTVLPENELEPGVQRISFEYVGFGYLMPEHVHYRVRMTGYEDEWIYRGDQLQSEYTNLPYGSYEFEVQARYPSGPWSASERFQFYVKRYYWQYPVFWLVVLGCFFVLMVAIWRWRIRALRWNEMELKRLVKEKTRKLENIARQDPLTGIANRRAFDEDLKKEMARASREQSSLSLAILDIDHFKNVNDQYLHTVGDEVLVEVSEIIQSCIREEDRMARWGGEEFSILLPRSGRTEAELVCERVRRGIEKHAFRALPKNQTITVSIGIALSQDKLEHSELLRRADQALYEAKEGGRNQIYVFSD